jgi:hypothetical protein
MSLLAVVLLTLPPAADPGPRADKYYKITVVDEQTGRGVPLVELRTVNNLRFSTDSNGVVAFREPGLMDQTVYFHVKSHGYEFAKDGFGYRGAALKVRGGGSARLTIKRINIAERLYRVTGGGIYADSLLVGQRTPLRRPDLNGSVLGSDSVVTALYRGKIYWFWGDTNLPAYPLGNFHVPGATSALPGEGCLDPENGIDLRYFLNEKGVAKTTAKLSGKGPTWISGLVTARGADKRERLYAGYMKVRPPMEIYERGLVEFDDDKEQFRQVTPFDLKAPLYPRGHPFKRTQGGIEYIYFADPYPLVRVPADLEQLRDPKAYEAFTCLEAGSSVKDGKIERVDGRARFAWKKNTPPVGPKEQQQLIRAGKLKADEALLHLQDADTGKAVLAHGGSVCWNAYRKRWVMIAVQLFGTSVLGEVWYAEADTPLGPWVYARKIITHDKYSFYNPKQHPLFDKHGGRVIFFEGTYSHSFSGNSEQTPRYDYNQILYKLDLSDPRLALPAPVYQRSGKIPSQFALAPQLGKEREGKQTAFFALDREVEGSVAVYASEVGLQVGKQAKRQKAAPLFYALPADQKDAPATALPLHEFIHQDGKQRAYSTDAAWSGPGFKRSPKPLCLVWRNPMSWSVPGP